jgi:hypothetical protein
MIGIKQMRAAMGGADRQRPGFRQAAQFGRSILAMRRERTAHQH